MLMEVSLVLYRTSSYSIQSLDLPNNYVWDFDFADGLQADAVGPLVMHTYNDNNTYEVTLTVSDTDGSSDTDTTFCIIADVDPVVTDITYTAPVNEGDTVLFDIVAAAGNAADPLTQVTYTFSDDGSSITTALGTAVPHTYLDNGIFTVTVTVFDEDSSTTYSENVVVANVDPV